MIHSLELDLIIYFITFFKHLGGFKLDVSLLNCATSLAETTDYCFLGGQL